MTRKEALIKSTIVALVISLILPISWVAFAGYTMQTPEIEKGMLDKMSTYEREKWLTENNKKVSFIEHVKYLPRVLSGYWKGLLEASLGVFVIVFVLNIAYLLGGRK